MDEPPSPDPAMDLNMASAFSNGNCRFLANPCRDVSNSSGFNIRSYNSIKMTRVITPRDTSERPICQVVSSLRRHPRCPRLGQRHRLSMPWSGYQAYPGHPVQRRICRTMSARPNLLANSHISAKIGVGTTSKCSQLAAEIR